MECGALFGLFNALGHRSPDEYRSGKLLLTLIGAMLSKLCLQGVACAHHFSGTCTSMFTSENTNFTHSNSTMSQNLNIHNTNAFPIRG
jgi:hypothetical protein